MIRAPRPTTTSAGARRKRATGRPNRRSSRVTPRGVVTFAPGDLVSILDFRFAGCLQILRGLRLTAGVLLPSKEPVGLSQQAARTVIRGIQGLCTLEVGGGTEGVLPLQSRPCPGVCRVRSSWVQEEELPATTSVHLRICRRGSTRRPSDRRQNLRADRVLAPTPARRWPRPGDCRPARSLQAERAQAEDEDPVRGLSSRTPLQPEHIPS